MEATVETAAGVSRKVGYSQVDQIGVITYIGSVSLEVGFVELIGLSSIDVGERNDVEFVLGRP